MSLNNFKWAVVFAILFVFASNLPADAQTFTLTGSMHATRSTHSATLLENGQVLIAGGSNNGATLGSAELYNPATGVFTLTGSLISPRYLHTATLLNNGKVLLLGGYSSGDLTLNAELYNPTTGTFTATGSMSSGRAGHSAVLLSNGQVLVMGGQKRVWRFAEYRGTL